MFTLSYRFNNKTLALASEEMEVSWEEPNRFVYRERPE